MLPTGVYTHTHACDSWCRSTPLNGGTAPSDARHHPQRSAALLPLCFYHDQPPPARQTQPQSRAPFACARRAAPPSPRRRPANPCPSSHSSAFCAAACSAALRLRASAENTASGSAPWPATWPPLQRTSTVRNCGMCWRTGVHTRTETQTQAKQGMRSYMVNQSNYANLINPWCRRRLALGIGPCVRSQFLCIVQDIVGLQP